MGSCRLATVCDSIGDALVAVERLVRKRRGRGPRRRPDWKSSILTACRVTPGPIRVDCRLGRAYLVE